MVRSIAVLGLALLSIASLPTGTEAQNPQTRQGFFIGLGIGAGSFGFEGGDGRETSGAAHITLGGTLTPQLLIGGEFTGWTKEEEGARVSHTNATAIVQFYPIVDGGFFLRGGIGGSTLSLSGTSGNVTISVDETALGATAGLGYDIRVGSNFSITPYGLFVWGNFEGGSASHFQGGLGVTWH
jgi:hypothetical protein